MKIHTCFFNCDLKSGVDVVCPQEQWDRLACKSSYGNEETDNFYR